MKYTTEVKINAPVEKVAALLADHTQMKKWVEEIESCEAISGEAGSKNAKTRIVINAATKKIVITATIMAVEFPKQVTTSYEMEDGSLLTESHLQSIEGGATLVTTNHEFNFSGMLKLATALMKPAFVKHTGHIMQNFKKIAEQPAM